MADRVKECDMFLVGLGTPLRIPQCQKPEALQFGLHRMKELQQIAITARLGDGSVELLVLLTEAIIIAGLNELSHLGNEPTQQTAR